MVADAQKLFWQPFDLKLACGENVVRLSRSQRTFFADGYRRRSISAGETGLVGSIEDVEVEEENPLCDAAALFHR